MKRALAWFAGNSVAANLMMLVIVASGLITLGFITVEIFPEMEADIISVSVLYLGAAPEEVEEGVCVKIEEAVQGLEGIKEIRSIAAEGLGTVLVEVERGYDTRELLDDVKNQVDAIDTFPEETERPIIQEITIKHQVLDIAVSGDTDERTLKVVADRVRDELTAIPGISQVDILNARPYEVSIEVSEHALRRYGIAFDDVVGAVRRSSLDLPGGSIKTRGGEFLLRAKGQAYRGPEFEEIVLLARPDGTYLRLGEVARVVDGFAETDQSSRFNGAPDILMRVYRVGDQSALEVADTAKAYVERAAAHLPEGIELTVWMDVSRMLRDRIQLLLRNGAVGFCLVFAMLALFLRFRLAFWVSLGIPISFLGAIWLMPTLDVTVNMISLFAFIVVLGIVVDDAIVVGESIFSEQERIGRGVKASVLGAHKVSVPVVFAVLTTVAVFFPILFVEGQMGKIMRVIPLIVIPCLLFSLVESLLILPAHLAHARHVKPATHGPAGWWRSLQGRITSLLALFIRKVYQPGLRFCLRWRYLTIAQGIAVLLLTLGLALGGWIKFSFFPSVAADNVGAALTMPLGTPVEVTARGVDRLEQAAREMCDELRETRGVECEGIVMHILTSVGGQPFRTMMSRMGANVALDFSGAHLGEVTLELSPAEERTISAEEIGALWREKTGIIPDAVELTFSSALFSSGEPINVQLTGPDLGHLTEAALRLRAKLAEYPGVFDIADTFREGKQEIKLGIKPAAETLGLSLQDLARQVRQGFYGEEAQRIQRGRDDVRVMVRYPEAERRSLADLENMRIRTREGGEVPFSTVAVAELGRGYNTIERKDRNRAINVTADLDASVANANEILGDLKQTYLPALLADYPGMLYSLEGEQKEQQESLSSLFKGFATALFVIFALLAVPLRSYVQPIVIMLAIPFGVVGAVWGHVIMGQQLTLMSMFGIVALAGVVVNDSLVLVDYLNRYRAEGHSLVDAAMTAGAVRFRPILLTSLTTFVGLTPLMWERSLQAQFLIPMAVSLAYGVIFATFITLVLVPAAILIMEDLRGVAAWVLKRLFGWELDLEGGGGRHGPEAFDVDEEDDAGPGPATASG